MRLFPDNRLLGHPLLLPVLLVAVILAAYYPAMLSGVHPIDDPGIFAKYSATPSLSSILLPGNGYYYRPIVEFSFYLDNLLWGMEPGIMHLENILLHCANSLLVYFLARKISRDDSHPLIPFSAALLFALHPVNVEAVAWIAGRPDPLLTIFVLLTCLFLLRWLDRPLWQDSVTALVLFSTALLTKETALAFGAVVVLLAFTWPGIATGRQRLMLASLITVPITLLAITAMILTGGTSALGRFVTGEFHVVQAMCDVLFALGFYVRKLIYPFPLNFAITEIHPLHGFLVILLLPLLWLMFRRYRLSAVFLVSALLLIMPALLVAVKQISWTPFAERYLYLSTAFFVLGLVGVFQTWCKRYSVILLSTLAFMLCVFGFSSYQRNINWNNPMSFFQDAVAKSPEFGSVYHSLGGLLIQNGDINGAAEAFDTADRLNKRSSMRYPIKSSIMGTKLAKGELLEARIYFFELFKEKRTAPADFLDILYKADSKRLESIEQDKKVPLAQDLLETLSLLNQKRPDPFLFYQSGKIALVAGKTKDAADFFRMAYSAAPVDAHYKAAAKTYFLRLEAEK